MVYNLMTLVCRKTALFLILPVFFSSCASQISGTLQASGQADLQVYIALEPRMTMLIGGLASASGTMQPDAPILDGPAISASMAGAPGIASVSLANRTPVVIEGPVIISRIGEFLAEGSGNTGFITFEQTPQGGRCTVNLSLEGGPQILGLISHEINDYLEALMAPLATGEVVSGTDYLVLVGSVYGRGIADEIANGSIRVYINFPGPVQSARGGTFSGRRAEFIIPLLDILVLENPLSYEVTWR